MFEFTGSAITELSTSEASTTNQPSSMGLVPLDLLARWEPLNSPDATMQLETKPQESVLIQNFRLDKSGEYTIISHALPGATAAQPTVSLRELTRIEVELQFDASEPITLEPRLIDDFGAVAGIVRVVTPSKGVQILHIPAASLKGYWGKNIDFSRVRRIELAVTRKLESQAAAGNLIIRRIELFGHGKKLIDPPMPTLNKFIGLPLKPDKWQTSSSKNAQISLNSEGEILKCAVKLSYERNKDGELPWINIDTTTEQKDLNQLAAIEFCIRWDGSSAITLEPKIFTSSRGDTYGRHIWIQPSHESQKVLVYLQDFKYYWSAVGPTEQTHMNLNDVRTFSLGISRKSLTQADSGTLYIEAIYFLSFSSLKQK